MGRKEVREYKRSGAKHFDFSSRFLGQGDEGADVRRVQEFLRSEGYFTLAETTKFFGPVTTTALMRWQQDVGVPATGLFGPMSRAAYNKIVRGRLAREAAAPASDAKKKAAPAAPAKPAPATAAVSKEKTDASVAAASAPASAAAAQPKADAAAAGGGGGGLVGAGWLAAAAIGVAFWLRHRAVEEERAIEKALLDETLEEDRSRQLDRFSAIMDSDREGEELGANITAGEALWAAKAVAEDDRARARGADGGGSVNGNGALSPGWQGEARRRQGPRQGPRGPPPPGAPSRADEDKY
eukprot:PRCOL_00006612-RA